MTATATEAETRLDGCTCRPVRGSHRPPCPWAMTSQRVNAAPRADRHAPGTSKTVRLTAEADGVALLADMETWAKAAGLSVNAALLLAWREFLETHRAGGAR